MSDGPGEVSLAPDEQRLRVGIDVGGTFTDFTVSDSAGNVALIWKQETTPADRSIGVLTGLAEVASALGLDGVADLVGQTEILVHGTTAATNAVIERNGPTVGLLCTKGFRDVLYFRNGLKPERFNIHLQHPEEFVDRHLRVGIAERVDRTGAVVTALDEGEVRTACTRFRAAGVKAVAIAFLWSMVNSEHELRAAEIVREELPECYVVTSYQVMPEIREWERTSATVLSAYILPVVEPYLHRLEERLNAFGLKRDLLIMQVNGGCAPVRELLRRPVYALHSGPAAAPTAALWYAQELGVEDLITVDMGGTSFDVCLVTNDAPHMTRDLEVDGQPIGVPAVEVLSIGAGGGSIAWIDPGGALRVGPRSAGAMPGPVCYGAGGVEPTVTDANLVLGVLSSDGFLAGRKPLDVELATDSIRTHIAEPLAMSAVQAAAGIIRVVNANMVGAIRQQSMIRGIDPRDQVLVVGGGAGGSHASSLARALGIRRVFVPREAGTFCSFGMTVTDVRHDYVRTHHATSDMLDAEAVSGVLATLEGGARERLAADGFADGEMELKRYVDARYPGQVHEITVPIPSGLTYSKRDTQAMEEQFHVSHHRHFSYSRPDLPVEFLHWRVSSTGSTGLAKPDSASLTYADAEDALLGEREVYFPEHGQAELTRIYSDERLMPGAELVGPAVIQAPTTTLVINPDDSVRVLASGGYELTIGGVSDNYALTRVPAYEGA